MRALADDDVPKKPAALPRQRSPLLRGLRTLELLKETPLTVSQIARMLDVNRSSAQRLLQELEGANYVVRDRATRRYSATHDPPRAGGNGRRGWLQYRTGGRRVGGAAPRAARHS